jgi:hypothetical protein
MTSRIRDRHDRGMRGPAFLPGPLAPRAVPARITSAERFDRLALAVVSDVVEQAPDSVAEGLARIELAVEEIPVLPEGWNERSVPLASYVDPAGGQPGRLVLFRRPLEHRAPTRIELDALLLTVVVEQLADVAGMAPEDLYPDYDAE